MTGSDNNASRGASSKSAVIRMFSKFSDYLRAGIKNGFFGSLFSNHKREIFKNKIIPDTVRRKVISPVRRYVCNQIDRSVTIHLFEKIKTYLLRCRLRVYGVFLLFFGVYSLIALLTRVYLLDSDLDLEWIILSCVNVLSSIPLILSSSSLSEALVRSRFGKWFINAFGYSAERVSVSGVAGRSNVAFILGLAAGAVAFLITPGKLIVGLLAVLLSVAVVCQPEIGVMTMFFALPWMNTEIAASFMIFLSAAYLIKVIRGKRTIRFELIDVFVAIFALVMTLGGFIPGMNNSVDQSFTYMWLTIGYFITVSVLRNREWLTRCSWAAICSVSIVSLIVLCAQLVPLADGVADFVPGISDMLTGYVSGLFATGDALNEYMIILFPILFGDFVSRNVHNRKPATRFVLFISLLACCYALFVSGMWLAPILAASLLLLIRNRHAIYMFIASGCAVPVLYFMFPDVYTELTTGMLPTLPIPDFEYRSRVWQGTMSLIKDNIFTGIGLGEDVWSSVYPEYAVKGFETATHSHNLFLQILSSVGIVGLIAFAICVFLAIQAGFSNIRNLSNSYAKSKEILSLSGSADKIEHSPRIYNYLKATAAAPLCAVITAVCVGATENIWQDARIYMLFWLVLGLAVAYARVGEFELERQNKPDDNSGQDGSNADVDIVLINHK